MISVLFNYTMAVFTHPGSPSDLSFDDLDESEVQCKKCNFPKPNRTHHCSICNQCILKMDHHCPW